jgi:hypothetical protein
MDVPSSSSEQDCLLPAYQYSDSSQLQFVFLQSWRDSNTPTLAWLSITLALVVFNRDTSFVRFRIQGWRSIRLRGARQPVTPSRVHRPTISPQGYHKHVGHILPMLNVCSATRTGLQQPERERACIQCLRLDTGCWWSWRDSNPRLLPCQGSALPLSYSPTGVHAL